MGTNQRSVAYHQCECGAEFESTEALLEHARGDHGLWVH